MKQSPTLQFDLQAATRLWFHQQGLDLPRGSQPLTRAVFVNFLERVGGLQLDSINVLDRAHYLTLWSRFGVYDRNEVDSWIYQDRVAYEYWGHEASILPISHLPLGKRRMRAFPPESWQNAAWWSNYQTSTASKRRVLKRLREEGALESTAFEKTARDREADTKRAGQTVMMPLAREDKRSLQLLWHAGKIAISSRQHFRRRYDLAEHVYPDCETASKASYEDSWLLSGLKGNGIASERHLMNYFTAPKLKGPERKRVIERNLKKKRIIEVSIAGQSDRFFMLPEYQELPGTLDDPAGTTLVCPFDSLLWQRKRAEDWLNFKYRIEIYIPQKKREYGYYVLPILHQGRFVGRLDPWYNRPKSTLEIKAIYLEEDFRRNARFDRGLRDTLHDLCTFLGASELVVPDGWSALS